MEARRWIELIPGFPVIVVGSVRVILLSGAYLAAKMAAFSLAWTQVSLAAVILMGALGAVTGMRMGAIRRACASATTIDTEQMGLLQDPFLKFSLGIRIAVFLGIVLIMAAKPESWESTAIVGASAILGVLSALLTWRRRGRLAAPRTDLRREALH